MKNVSKYLLFFTVVILIISAFVAISSISSARAASTMSMKTVPEDFTRTGKTVPIFTNQKIKQGQEFTSVFVNTRGYQSAVLYVRVIGSPSLDISGQFSIDGTNVYNQDAHGDQYTQDQFSISIQPSPGQVRYTMAPFTLLGPMFRIMVLNESSPAYPPLATVSATLYLIS